MVPSIARQSVILKCNMQKSVMLGNYEFFYAAGLMRKLYNIEIRTDMEPEQILEAILQMQDNLAPQSEPEKYLIQIIKNYEPKHNLWANMGKAFLLGGGICLLGQIILQIAAGVFGLKAEDAALWCSLLLVLLSVILTSCNVYGILANWGGAGALVPITGFANGVCASAVEFQKEGQVFGIGCQIFKIAGPVILYGIFSSWVLGLIYWLF